MKESISIRRKVPGRSNPSRHIMIEWCMAADTQNPDNELPDWMKLARRGVDWGVLFVMGLGLFFAWPFLRHEHFPGTTQSEHHIFRTADAAVTLQEGRIYPRWSPYALGGYGAPIPHYEAPGVPLSAAMLDVLLTNNAEQALRSLYILAFIMGGSSLYVLVMQRVHAIAGVVSATLYLSSPYIGLVLPHLLGDAPAIFAFGLVPALLWAVNRLLMRNQAFDFLYIVLLSALLLMTEPRLFFASWWLVGALFLVHGLERAPWKRVPVVLAGLLVGMGTVAFFWLPALLERDSVQWAQLPAVNNLQLTLRGLLQPVELPDPAALIPPAPLSLGWALLLLSVLSVVYVLWKLRKRRVLLFQGVFLALGLLLSILGIELFPHSIWLLGFISLSLAMGGSALVYDLHWIVSWQRRLILFGLGLLIAALSAPMWVYDPPPGSERDFSPAAQMRYEQAGYGIAVLPPGGSVPLPLAEAPISDWPPLETEAAASVIHRLRHVEAAGFQAVLPTTTRREDAPAGTASTRLEGEEPPRMLQGTHLAQYEIITDEALSVIYRQAFFPAWYATLNETPLPISRDLQSGLTQIQLPADSTGTLIIAMGTTSIITGAWIISAAFWIVTGLVVAIRWKTLPVNVDEGRLLERHDAYFLFAMLVLLFVGRSAPLIAEPLRALLPSPTPQVEAARALPTAFQSQISTLRLVAYCFDNPEHVFVRLPFGAERLASPGAVPRCAPANEYQAGERLALDLYWETGTPTATSYAVQLSAWDANADIWWQSAIHPPGNYAVNRWQPERYVLDSYEIAIPPDIALGAHSIEVAIFTCSWDRGVLSPDCTRLNAFILPERIVIP